MCWFDTVPVDPEPNQRPLMIRTCSVRIQPIPGRSSCSSWWLTLLRLTDPLRHHLTFFECTSFPCFETIAQ